MCLSGGDAKGESVVEARMRCCPVCGAAFGEGKLYTMGRMAGKFYISGSLCWKASRRIPRKHPLRLFGRVYFAEMTVRVRLMSDGDDGVPGWYCPNCKKVFAWFDAPDVPPELGGESAKPEEGA